MKKLISLALCLAMVLTIFTINASALVETGTVEGYVPETVYVGQDFSNVTTNTAFTEKVVADDATVSFTGGVAAITNNGEAKSGGFKYVGAVGSSNFTFEFNITSPTISVATSVFEVYFYEFDTKFRFRPAKLASQYNVTYRIVFEDGVATSASYNQSGNWVDISWYTTSNNPNSWTDIVKNDITSDDTGIAFIPYALGNIYHIDNIKVYNPEVAGTPVVYSINNDMIMGTYTTEYTHTLTEAPATDTAAFRTLVDKKNTTEDVVVYADLKNSGDGTYPISVAIGSNQYGASAHILAANAIKGAWYTYKICYKNDVNIGDEVNRVWRIVPQSVYRRPANGGEWTLLAEGTDWIQGGADDGFSSLQWNTSNRPTGRVQIGYESTLTGYTAAGTTWNSKKVQVIDACALTGTKTIADGKITLNLNVGSCGAAIAILAVYNGNVLADVDYVTPAVTADTITLTANYAEGNKVMLYVWDSLANAEPINVEPLAIIE